jgi:hypothetical protein
MCCDRASLPLLYGGGKQYLVEQLTQRRNVPVEARQKSCRLVKMEGRSLIHRRRGNLRQTFRFTACPVNFHVVKKQRGRDDGCGNSGVG